MDMAASTQSLRKSEREEAATDEGVAVANDVAVDDTAAVPVPGDDPAKANTADATDELESPEAIVIAVRPKPVVRVRTLEDRSKYHGEINALDEPHGAGVLDSCFGSKYAGEFRDGKKHGCGVQVYINGSTYAGEFAEDQPSGYGAHTSPFAEKYLGQWAESARHGIGLCIESNAEIVFGQFADNERDEATNVPWESVQEHMQRALVAEHRALRVQEAARERQLQAVLEELSAVDTTSFQDAEQITQFEAQEQLELQQFVKEQNDIVAEVERIADVHKFKEAELKQHQKVLRAEIDTKSKELSFVAKFCSSAIERKAQVEDAERTLQTQLHMLVQLQQQPALQDEASK